MVSLGELSTKELKKLQEDIKTELVNREEITRKKYQKEINDLIKKIQDKGFSVCNENGCPMDYICVQ